MPHKPPAPCPKPGCRNLQPCPLHPRQQRARGRDRRPDAAVRGYATPTWQRTRKRAIEEQRYCQGCGASVYEAGQIARGTTVHHIDRDPSNNQPSNLAVMCRACHERTHGRKR